MGVKLVTFYPPVAKHLFFATIKALLLCHSKRSSSIHLRKAHRISFLPSENDQRSSISGPCRLSKWICVRVLLLSDTLKNMCVFLLGGTWVSHSKHICSSKIGSNLPKCSRVKSCNLDFISESQGLALLLGAKNLWIYMSYIYNIFVKSYNDWLTVLYTVYIKHICIHIIVIYTLSAIIACSIDCFLFLGGLAGNSYFLWVYFYGRQCALLKHFYVNKWWASGFLNQQAFKMSNHSTEPKNKQYFWPPFVFSPLAPAYMFATHFFAMGYFTLAKSVTYAAAVLLSTWSWNYQSMA